jgi:hypothetical protein
MGRSACTEPQCLYKGAPNLYLYLPVHVYACACVNTWNSKVPSKLAAVVKLINLNSGVFQFSVGHDTERTYILCVFFPPVSPSIQMPG